LKISSQIGKIIISKRETQKAILNIFLFLADFLSSRIKIFIILIYNFLISYFFSQSCLFLLGSCSFKSFAVKKETQGFIEKAIIIESKRVTIANFGIGHIYSHIIPVTANMETKDKTFVIVESTTQGPTSSTASKIACNLVFFVSNLSSRCL